MQSSWSASPDPAGAEDRPDVVRRFVEASRRAEIIALVNSAGSDREVARATVDELCEALEAELAFLVVTRPDRGERETIGHLGLTPAQADAVGADPLTRAAFGTARPRAHAGEDLLGLGVRRLALSPWTADGGRQVVIGVGRLYDEPFDAAEIALLEAVTASVGHALERAWLAAERDRHAAQQAALARAAKELSASLVGREVLQALSSEVAKALAADVVAVFGAGDRGAMELVAGTGVQPGPTADGHEAPAERVARDGRPHVWQPSGTTDGVALPGGDAARSAVAAPIRLQEDVEGVVLAAYQGDRWIEREDVELLMAFAELAAIAWRNAADHAAAQRAASLDSLTGCLNHGAFQDRLREEIARAGRNGTSLALVLMDMNEFKAVNDTLGHLVGDSLLRGVADALRSSVRAYDQVARYGGDEFALLLPCADEEAARRVVDRAQAAVAGVTLPQQVPVSACAGLAHWRAEEEANVLIARADRALLEAKRARGRGPGRRAGDRPSQAAAAQRERQRLRRLATAGSLGTRLARLLDQRAIAETAIVELGAALGYGSCTLVRRDADGELAVVAATGAKGRAGGRRGRGAEVGPGVETAGVDALPGARFGPGPASRSRAGAGASSGSGSSVGSGSGSGFGSRLGSGSGGQMSPTLRRSLRERRTVLDAGVREGLGVCSELAVPVYVGGELWGALGVRSGQDTPFGDDDAQLVQTVADHLGTALRTAELYEQLDQTHMGTAEALAAALEAKDTYTADHARSIADLAVAVGRAMGMDDEGLRDLRYGAIFHDIGKIAIPDAILNKPGPLTEDEFAVVRRHPVVGEQILSPVPFLSGVRRIVRHDHERWDGTGYPDGLRGEAIPLGARIVLVVDAYHAMCSDRPYRRAMPPAEAQDELRRGAGTQFDPDAVDALLDVLAAAPA
jgi:diguanylate cyclase (GGDEF)-like protein